MNYARLFLLFSICLTLVVLGGVGNHTAKANGRKTPIRDAPAEFLAMENPFTSEADIKKGARYYKGKCSECHGEDGTPEDDEPSFNDKERMSTRKDGQMFYIIKFGNGDDAEMEAWGEGSDAAMSDQKIWQMVAFIRTLSK